jgi:hypothetical protein
MERGELSPDVDVEMAIDQLMGSTPLPDSGYRRTGDPDYTDLLCTKGGGILSVRIAAALRTQSLKRNRRLLW